jgi:hypothetical protein
MEETLHRQVALGYIVYHPFDYRQCRIRGYA